MSPQERIKDLCQRYDVSTSFGSRMLPLAERAEQVRPELQRRLIAFLERSFVAQSEIEAAEAAEEAKKAPMPPEERKVLGAVADALHEWEPPRWLDRWAQRLQSPEAGRGGEKAG